MKAIEIGAVVERLDPTSLSHRMRGEILADEGERLTVKWANGKTTKVALAAQGKRWQLAG